MTDRVHDSRRNLARAVANYDGRNRYIQFGRELLARCKGFK
jgi:hypothetical protein